MNIEKLTTQLRKALVDAQSHALGKNHTAIESTHVLIALLNKHTKIGKSFFGIIHLKIVAKTFFTNLKIKD